MAASPLTSQHHAFMQWLMARGSAPEADARQLYKDLTRLGDDSGFDPFWALINKELAFVSLEMRRVNLPPEPGAARVRYVGIVNKLDDEVAKQATRLSPAQLALFRAIVEHVAKDKHMALHGMDSLKVQGLPIAVQVAAPAGGEAAGGVAAGGAGAAKGPPPVKEGKLKPSERESTLDSLVADGWLMGDGEGYRVGPRSFLELSTFLLECASDEVEEIWRQYV